MKCLHRLAQMSWSDRLSLVVIVGAIGYVTAHLLVAMTIKQVDSTPRQGILSAHSDER